VLERRASAERRSARPRLRRGRCSVTYSPAVTTSALSKGSQSPRMIAAADDLAAAARPPERAISAPVVAHTQYPNVVEPAAHPRAEQQLTNAWRASIASDLAVSARCASCQQVSCFHRVQYASSAQHRRASCPYGPLVDQSKFSKFAMHRSGCVCVSVLSIRPEIDADFAPNSADAQRRQRVCHDHPPR